MHKNIFYFNLSRCLSIFPVSGTQTIKLNVKLEMSLTVALQRDARINISFEL